MRAGEQIELRRYAACIVAKKVLNATAADAADAAEAGTQEFPIRVGCISGKNKGQQRLEATAPQLPGPPLRLREASRAAIVYWPALW